LSSVDLAGHLWGKPPDYGDGPHVGLLDDRVREPRALQARGRGFGGLKTRGWDEKTAKKGTGTLPGARPKPWLMGPVKRAGLWEEVCNFLGRSRQRGLGAAMVKGGNAPAYNLGRARARGAVRWMRNTIGRLSLAGGDSARRWTARLSSNTSRVSGRSCAAPRTRSRSAPAWDIPGSTTWTALGAPQGSGRPSLPRPELDWGIFSAKPRVGVRSTRPGPNS